MTHSKKLRWAVYALLMVLVGWFGWLLYSGSIVFESNITALLPTTKDSGLVKKIDSKIATAINNRIAIIIQGQNSVKIDAATDRMTDLIDQGIIQKRIVARMSDDLETVLFSARIEAMLKYKDRLLADRSRQRMQKSIDSQLQWRMSQVTQFPASNITDPVRDPLGTLEEFLAERLPSMHGVHFDGLYLRVDNEIPANLLLLELVDGELGNAQAMDSIRWISDARDAVAKEFDVKLFLSGIPLHATAIKENIVQEIRWMAILALALTMGIFLYVTRSIRALLLSAALILMAITGGIVISHGTIGLPHLIGLTMASTAIGICIDFSLHFWIHIRAGMSGAAAMKTIQSGINMSFITTVIGLLVISFTSIPVLARSAVFICGALLISWLMVLFLFPQMVGDTATFKSIRAFRRKLPKHLAVGLVLLIACISAIGLMSNYYTDDNPSRLGHQVNNLIADDQVVQNLLGISGPPSVYLVQAKSAESLIEAEIAILEPLTDNELSQVNAVSRLVIDESQQRANQSLFMRAEDSLDTTLMRQYLTALQVSELEWTSETDKKYSLQWVLEQPWASIERDAILTCDYIICASIIRARGAAVKKLNASCQQRPDCKRISLLERQMLVFESIRSSIVWTVLLAFGAIFVVLYLRYRNKAFKLITIPMLASVSGISAVAWAGMPITAFTLAAVFPLLGLSLDYIIFATESKEHSASTFLAIFASALTTSLSFWILSFSNTPAIQFFAVPVAVGIPVAWILVHLVQSEHA